MAGSRARVVRRLERRRLEDLEDGVEFARGTADGREEAAQG